jgi:hypothetical protein
MRRDCYFFFAVFSFAFRVKRLVARFDGRAFEGVPLQAMPSSAWGQRIAIFRRACMASIRGLVRATILGTSAETAFAKHSLRRFSQKRRRLQ